MSGFRKHGRKQAKHAVKLSHDSWGEFVAETRDISATGFFASCRNLPKFIAVGDDFRAKMYLDSANEFLTDVTVVRVTDDGMGVEYL